MALTLNFTAPLKQDAESQQQLQQLAALFAEKIQPVIDRELAKSELVHFARILVIDNKYIQVLTEFDGDPMQYTEFFRQELGPVFEAIFSLVKGAPPWDELNNPNDFYEYTHGLNLKALGTPPRPSTRAALRPAAAGHRGRRRRPRTRGRLPVCRPA
ncbi:MAG TPA: hypothetical protein VGO16_02655 [Pseudonocardiaceae bacterium]|jgi:hypothetical protein|nr:hypothetical protein [Pseudonocardiaceae bacterium]